MDGGTNLTAVNADIMNCYDPQTAGVYPASLDSPIKELAVCKTGDSKTHFNGTARVNMDGGLDYAGADKP